jgi:hypothetical protein
MGAQPINQAKQDNIIEGVYYSFNKIDNFFLEFFQTLNPWPPPSMHHNLGGHDLTIIVVRNLLFIGSYGIDPNVTHLLVSFAHQYCAHCFDMNVICISYCLNADVVCLYVLFTHENCAHNFRV